MKCLNQSCSKEFEWVSKPNSNEKLYCSMRCKGVAAYARRLDRLGGSTVELVHMMKGMRGDIAIMVREMKPGKLQRQYARKYDVHIPTVSEILGVEDALGEPIRDD